MLETKHLEEINEKSSSNIEQDLKVYLESTMNSKLTIMENLLREYKATKNKDLLISLVNVTKFEYVDPTKSESDILKDNDNFDLVEMRTGVKAISDEFAKELHLIKYEDIDTDKVVNRINEMIKNELSKNQKLVGQGKFFINIHLESIFTPWAKELEQYLDLFTYDPKGRFLEFNKSLANFLVSFLSNENEIVIPTRNYRTLTVGVNCKGVSPLYIKTIGFLRAELSSKE